MYFSTSTFIIHKQEMHIFHVHSILKAVRTCIILALLLNLKRKEN
jgi:hypothetical protein